MIAGAKQLGTIERVGTSVMVVPTEEPESDGTLMWDRTNLLVVEVMAGGADGLGYSYTHPAAATVVEKTLAPLVAGKSPLAATRLWLDMRRAVRNFGAGGIAASAIAAMDMALWDLRAKLVDLPLVALLGSVRASVPVYGSGGFTSLSDDDLALELAGFAAAGMFAVKMKVGREPARDRARVRVARAALPDDVELFIDANGAYSRKQALALAQAIGGLGVTWFEEPVTADDREGLRLLRDRAPIPMRIVAGEYLYAPETARAFLTSGAVDVLQADVTRCLGITGFLRIATLAEAFHMPLSAHTAPAAHLHLGCALPAVAHLEYFADHVRIEDLLFEGVPALVDGTLAPDLLRPGLGISLRRAEAARFAA